VADRPLGWLYSNCSLVIGRDRIVALSLGVIKL